MTFGSLNPESEGDTSVNAVAAGTNGSVCTPSTILLAAAFVVLMLVLAAFAISMFGGIVVDIVRAFWSAE